MQKIIKLTALALVVAFIASGCASTRSSKHACGCTGMIGYK